MRSISVFTGRERDKRYNQFILNVDNDVAEWRFSTLQKAFAAHLKITDQPARKFSVDNPEALDEFVESNADRVIRLARPDYDSVSQDARNNIDASKASRNRVLRLMRDKHSIAVLVADRRQNRSEDYLVSHLIDEDAIDYDTMVDLLYKLASQVVARLQAYLPDEEDVENVLLVHGKPLAEFVFRQMMQHYVETPTRYTGRVSRGFQLLKPVNFKVSDLKTVRAFRRPVTPFADTRRQVFGGFKKCVFPYQAFQSDDERRFAVLIDLHEAGVSRWVKPGAGQFRIEYRRG